MLGCCIATQQSAFRGSAVAIVVTGGRLIVQKLNRRFEPTAPPLSLPPERIADASAEGGGGGWASVEAGIMDRAAVTLKLRTTDGEKLKLRMMRGGDGLLGGLGGGEYQQRGVQAIGEWFAAHG